MTDFLTELRDFSLKLTDFPLLLTDNFNKLTDLSLFALLNKNKSPNIVGYFTR